MSTDNNLDALRGHLFKTLAALRDKSDPMDIERARAVSDVARTIISSAKVEVEYLRLAGGGESAFIKPEGEVPAGNAVKPPALANGIGGVTRHLLKG